MNKFYSTNYWSVGFQSNLYDRLSPESYFESMRRMVEFIPNGKHLNLLDAGCGSGLLLQFLSGRIKEGMSYTGIDILQAGVERALFRAKELGITNKVSFFQSDLTLPLTGEKFDVIVCHFSLYTISSNEKRKKSYQNLKSLMKPGGLIILTNPSIAYDIDSIIGESILLVRNRHGYIASFIRQTLFYPLTKYIGLRFIQKKLREREWKAYTREELLHEMIEAGFTVQHIEEVYAGSALLGVGKL